MSEWKEVKEASGKVRYLNLATGVLHDQIVGSDAHLASLEARIAALEERIAQLEQKKEVIVMLPTEISVGSSTFTVPPNIPPTARELLLYLSIQTGARSGDKSVNVRVLTKQPTGESASKAGFIYHIYDQNAWSYNSDNVWLVLTPERKIYVEGGSVDICILGYKI